MTASLRERIKQRPPEKPQVKQPAWVQRMAQNAKELSR